MTDPAHQSASNPKYLPRPAWERLPAPTPAPVELEIMPGAAAMRVQGHEAAVRALVSQLEGVVELAGFSVTEAWLLPEILHDEPSSDHLFLVLKVAGFQRQEDRPNLWDRIIDLVFDNEDFCVAERLTLVLQRAEPRGS